MCNKNYGTASLQVQLECKIREYIHRYYEGWTVCDDPTCGNRARMMGVYGRRCLKNGCYGSVSFEVSNPTAFYFGGLEVGLNGLWSSIRTRCFITSCAISYTYSISRKRERPILVRDRHSKHTSQLTKALNFQTRYLRWWRITVIFFRECGRLSRNT